MSRDADPIRASAERSSRRRIIGETPPLRRRPVTTTPAARLTLRNADAIRDKEARRLQDAMRSANAPGIGQPITGTTDPRWVLALRTAEQLEGATLRPERRDRLVRLGKVMGLSPFDCNLVIAIVQDQARRGYAPAYCPAAGEKQLTLVPLPRFGEDDRAARARRMFYLSFMIAGFIVAELLLLRMLF